MTELHKNLVTPDTAPISDNPSRPSAKADKLSETESLSLPDKFVITIGRQMGSGGRHLGRLLADRLAIPYYDRELLIQAAQEAGLSPEFFERNDERRPHFISGLFSFTMGVSPVGYHDGASTIGDDMLYRAQCDFIHRIAAQGPCVIVGRSADYVLRDVENVVNVFVHATPEDCVKRIRQRQPELSEERARAIHERTNKLRANFYNFYTDKRWGDASGYDLTFNSSTMPLEDITEVIVHYLKRRFTRPAK